MYTNKFSIPVSRSSIENIQNYYKYTPLQTIKNNPIIIIVYTLEDGIFK